MEQQAEVFVGKFIPFPREKGVVEIFVSDLSVSFHTLS